MAIKIGLTVFAVGMWLLTQKILGARKMKFTDSIGDWIHIATDSWNVRLNNSPKMANALLISSSLVVDAVGVFLIARSFWGPSVQPLLALIALFGLRQLNQAITVLPTPQGMIWRDPGVPSIFVTYGVSNDLFFSGHTALAVLGALEVANLGGGLWMALAIAIVIYEIAVVLLLRAHWTMDVFAGAVTAFWIYDVIAKVTPAVDSWLAQF